MAMSKGDMTMGMRPVNDKVVQIGEDDEVVMIVCKADLINPELPPVFASAEPQAVLKRAVEKFPEKF